MLTWPHTVRIFLCTQATDMRCGFDRLANMAQTVTAQDPLGGSFFVFLNRRRDRVKILYWDTSGYCLWYKRLEAGRFCLPQEIGDDASTELDRAQLTLILDGIELSASRRRKRFKLPAER